MKLNNCQEAFLALVRAGLWSFDDSISSFQEDFDWAEVIKIAEEQSVLGLATAGIKSLPQLITPKEIELQAIGKTLIVEQQNRAMNDFIGRLSGIIKEEKISALLIKGQGIAQCYEEPLWRLSGDVDLLLDASNYRKAKDLLCPVASSIDMENQKNMHLGMTIEGWVVELHGTLRSQLGRKIDHILDEIQEDCFRNKSFRVWKDGATEVALPSENDDVIFVFTHILQHFFRGGIGLKQICDWCRLLWVYKETINKELLRFRLFAMGVETEWKAFAALAVDYLGMPADAMPFYLENTRWNRKARKILACIFETGNLGHNRDNSHYQKYPFLVYKAVSLCRNTGDSIRHFFIFPKDATRVWWLRLKEGVEAVLNGR